MDFNQEQHIQTIKGRHDIFLCKQLNLFRDAKVDLRTNSVFSQQRKKTYPTTIFYDLKYHDNRLTMYQSFCKEPCDFEFSPSELATGWSLNSNFYISLFSHAAKSRSINL